MPPGGDAAQQTHRALEAMLCVPVGHLSSAGRTYWSTGPGVTEHVPQRLHAVYRNAVRHRCRALDPVLCVFICVQGAHAGSTMSGSS